MRKQKLTAQDKRLLRRIGAQVKGCMGLSKLTSESLATQAGIARSTLREIVAGRSNVRLGNVAKVARALGWGSLSKFLDAAGGFTSVELTLVMALTSLILVSVWVLSHFVTKFW